MRPDETAINAVLASAGIEAQIAEESVGVLVRVEQSDAPAALAALRDSDFDFVMLLDLFGTDTGERIEMTYHLRSLARDEEIYVRCGVEYDGELQSVWNVYPSALLPERETAELLGMLLAGHPNPKRLLTTDGVAPLLRKSVPVRTAEEVRAR